MVTARPSFPFQMLEHQQYKDRAAASTEAVYRLLQEMGPDTRRASPPATCKIPGDQLGRPSIGFGDMEEMALVCLELRQCLHEEMHPWPDDMGSRACDGM